MSNKPLVMTDNLAENVVLHPTFVLGQSGSDDVAGHEIFRVADNLRDLTSWSPAALNTARTIYVDCLTAVTPNTIALDRGHNLAGIAVVIKSFTDTTLATATTIATCTIPSTPGGLPTDANGCVTPDGVWWKTFSPSSNRVQGLVIPAMGAGIAPIVTGFYIGTSYRFAEYLKAPGAFDYGTDVKYMRNELSRGGVRSKSRGINLDKLPITIDLDSADYPAFDTEIRRMLRYNCPIWFSYDDADSSGVGQMRLFQLPGDLSYKPNANPVHREIQIDFEEVIPSLYA
jgi:hypothetical protein